MKVDRKKCVLKTGSDDGNGFVQASAQELIDIVEELTAEMWAIKEGCDAQQRLQRNVTKLIRR